MAPIIFYHVLATIYTYYNQLFSPSNHAILLVPAAVSSTYLNIYVSLYISQSLRSLPLSRSPFILSYQNIGRYAPSLSFLFSQVSLGRFPPSFHLPFPPFLLPLYPTPYNPPTLPSPSRFPSNWLISADSAWIRGFPHLILNS